jgi:phospholipid-binding lipoprotein MlaA
MDNACYLQTGVYNFFNNLKTLMWLLTIFYRLIAQGAYDNGRFALNTTMGLGGFVDVAKVLD